MTMERGYRLHVDEMEIERICPLCGHVQILTVSKIGWDKWNHGKGEFIQDAFPAYDSSIREQILNGVCLDCQKSLFG